MVRNPKRKALYEVIGKGGFKPRYGELQGQARSKEPDKDKAIGAKAEAAPGESAHWLRKPRVIRLNAGRIEISVPYQLAIAIGLGVVLLLLVAFRLGQISGGREDIVEAGTSSGARAGQKLSKSQIDQKEPTVSASIEQPKVSASKGNSIVIQTYRRRDDLEPVREYFAQFGIQTDIRKTGRWYYLITKDKYENPEKSGTDGYSVKQKIIKLGANYKAPEGYETFAPNFFKDAYSKKFEN